MSIEVVMLVFMNGNCRFLKLSSLLISMVLMKV